MSTANEYTPLGVGAAGSTLTQISHQLGASRSTIERDLGKRAAA
jgi:IS30 family transposase